MEVILRNTDYALRHLRKAQIGDGESVWEEADISLNQE
jgi:hypothetical protein